MTGEERLEAVMALTKMMMDNLERLEKTLEHHPVPTTWWADEDRAEFRRLRIQLTKQMKRLDDFLYREDA